MSHAEVTLTRTNRVHFQLHFTPALPWRSVNLDGNHFIQSIFYELDLHPIQVRIQTPEDPEAIVLFPIHFGSREYAHLYLALQLYKLRTPRLTPNIPFDDLLEFMDLALESNIYEQEVRILYLHALVEHYDA